MDHEQPIRQIWLHFEGAGTRDHTVPAQAFVRSIEQIQRVIFLLAKFVEGGDHGLRARFSHDLEQQFALICGVPEEGGYALPADIGDPSLQLFENEKISEVADLFYKLSIAIDREDIDKIRYLVPDRVYQSSLFKAYKAAQPPKRTGIIISIEDYRREKILDGTTSRRKLENIESSFKKYPSDYTPGYVTGHLVRMDFADRRLRLKLVSGRTIDASYGEDYEPTLLEHPRDLIQVHGNVSYDADDNPESLSEVDEIFEVDDSTITVKEIIVNNKIYRTTPHLELQPEFDRENGCYTLSGEFGIEHLEFSRKDLEEAVDTYLELLLVEYAFEDDEKLTPKAQELAAALRDRFRERANGS